MGGGDVGECGDCVKGGAGGVQESAGGSGGEVLCGDFQGEFEGVHGGVCGRVRSCGGAGVHEVRDVSVHAQHVPSPGQRPRYMYPYS